MTLNKICVIGLGLIGGSLVKGLKRRNPKLEIAGFDIDINNLKHALDEGTINRAASCPAEAVLDADLTFVCAPVGKIPSLLEEIADAVCEGSIVTDVGSTKHEIVNAARAILPPKVTFIGGHPMAGTEQSGYMASIPHLFENAYYLLTPLPDTPTEALERVSSLLATLGAIPLIMDPKVHDKIVGSISHLPHVVASSLVNTVIDLEEPNHYKEKLAAGGFRDITRIASSNPDMWMEISCSNRHELLKLISSMIHNLSKFRELLQNENRQGMIDFFGRAKEFRENLPARQSLVMLPYHDLYVDVEDRPGVIGEITTLLGKHDINIKNLRIINSREGEPGCLVLSLADALSLNKALDILVHQGYKTYKK